MIDKTHDLPVIRQVQLLELSRSSIYYQPQAIRTALQLIGVNAIGLRNTDDRGARLATGLNHRLLEFLRLKPLCADLASGFPSRVSTMVFKGTQSSRSNA